MFVFVSLFVFFLCRSCSSISLRECLRLWPWENRNAAEEGGGTGVVGGGGAFRWFHQRNKPIIIKVPDNQVNVYGSRRRGSGAAATQQHNTTRHASRQSDGKWLGAVGGASPVCGRGILKAWEGRKQFVFFSF